MFSGAIDYVKGIIHFEKEHSKSDRQYIDRLQELLKSDAMCVRNELTNKKQIIEMYINSNGIDSVDDKFLLTKCEDVLTSTNRLLKKLEKYTEKRKVKYKKFKEMYAVYVIIAEANKNATLMQDYIVQLRKYDIEIVE